VENAINDVICQVEDGLIVDSGGGLWELHYEECDNDLCDDIQNVNGNNDFEG
jgi:hypothetical protein